ENVGKEHAVKKGIWRDRLPRGRARGAAFRAARRGGHSPRGPRRSLCQVLSVAGHHQPIHADDVRSAQLVIAAARPGLIVDAESVDLPDEPLASWNAALERLLAEWI